MAAEASNQESLCYPGINGNYTVTGRLVLSGGETTGKICPGYDINGHDTFVAGTDQIYNIEAGASIVNETGSTAFTVTYGTDTTVEPARPYIRITGTADTTYGYQYNGLNTGAMPTPNDMLIYG